MIDLYQLALSGDPGTSRARTLRSLRGQHQQHLVQLKARLIVPPGASASPSPSPSSAPPSASPSPRASTVSITRLRAAERASAADLVRRLATAPPALAQLLASIAASDATHVTALGG